MATKCFSEERTHYLLISHEKLFNHPPFGMTSRCRISITEYEYVVHIMMREVKRRSLNLSDCNNLLSKYATNSMACPGLDNNIRDN